MVETRVDLGLVAQRKRSVVDLLGAAKDLGDVVARELNEQTTGNRAAAYAAGSDLAP